MTPAIEHGAGDPPREGLWNVRQCADYLQMSVSWVYKAVEAGQLPHAKLGRKALRFSPSRVREFARSMMSDGAGESRGNVIPFGKRGAR